jgi:hypothetical protein
MIKLSKIKQYVFEAELKGKVNKLQGVYLIYYDCLDRGLEFADTYVGNLMGVHDDRSSAEQRHGYYYLLARNGKNAHVRRFLNVLYAQQGINGFKALWKCQYQTLSAALQLYDVHDRDIEKVWSVLSAQVKNKNLSF